MKYEDTGFRPIYQSLCVFMLDDSQKNIIKSFPNANNANAILGYGYIDHKAGLTVETLACAKVNENDIIFFEGESTEEVKFRIGSLENNDFYIINDDKLLKKYSEEIELIHKYYSRPEIEETRFMTFLDESRDKYYIDDVLVYLIKDKCHPEGCWVRISSIEQNCLKGSLLNEPDQDFGCHSGEEIAFNILERDEKSIICCSKF